MERQFFATLISDASNAELVEDLQVGQLVFGTILRPFFRKLDYGEAQQEITRFWPLGKRNRIVLDPARQFGKPIDDKTGVPADTLYRATIAGGGQDERIVAEWFDVPVSAVRRAVQFEQSLSA